MAFVCFVSGTVSEVIHIGNRGIGRAESRLVSLAPADDAGHGYQVGSLNWVREDFGWLLRLPEMRKAVMRFPVESYSRYETPSHRGQLSYRSDSRSNQIGQLLSITLDFQEQTILKLTNILLITCLFSIDHNQAIDSDFSPY